MSNKQGLNVSMLKNSYLYFFTHVFIVEEEEGKNYRLFVVSNGECLTNKCYKSWKGAKISFLKFWQYKAYRDSTKPKWTHKYPCDPKWLQKIYEVYT